jgi:zinc/manganese transport system substrate-binding protein
MRNLRKFTLLVLILFIGAILFLGIAHIHKTAPSSSDRLQVVAAENFWGSLVTQIGGSKVQVTSIVTDPNADPHEYESNSINARAFSTANYVILNGAGYDSWGNKLLNASPNSNRKELTVANLLGKKNGDNPHFWYNPVYVNTVVTQMEHDLIKLDPTNKSYYEARYATLKSSLTTYQLHITDIKNHFHGTQVASTEDIFAYLAQSAGLNLISPTSFSRAVSEGNDPPTSSIVQFQQQLQSGQVKVLVYNAQTVTPLTNSIKRLASEKHIPLVAVTETVQPTSATFQEWMNSQLINLENALTSQASKR